MSSPALSAAAAPVSGAAASGAAAPYGTSGKAPRRTSGNTKNHSRSYPRGVGLDFRKLAGLTLLNYIDHHGTQKYLRAATR